MFNILMWSIEFIFKISYIANLLGWVKINKYKEEKINLGRVINQIYTHGVCENLQEWKYIFVIRVLRKICLLHSVIKDYTPTAKQIPKLKKNNINISVESNS